MDENKVEITFKNQPVQVLLDLIEKRKEALHQGAEKAVIVTAIQTLKSIRTLTKDATKKKKVEIKVEDTGWFGGFSNTTKNSCVRDGVSPYSRRVNVDGRLIDLCAGKHLRQSQKRVFKVTSEHLRKKPYYVIAMTAAEAIAYEQRATQHRIQNYGKLAKNALTIAMSKLAAKTNLEGSEKSKQVASKAAQVNDAYGNGFYELHIVDELSYSIEALKGGEGAIDLAMMKAANMITARLNKFAENDFDKLETPFPEIQSRRKK